MRASEILIALGTVASLAVFMWRRRRHKRLKRTWNKPKTLTNLPLLKPGNGSPLFCGVRVVELATVVAAPSCSRIMSDLGAEVVKIEEPNGDYWRKFFLPYESERDFSTAFEAVNLGKRSIVLNLRSASGVESLMQLLEQADVFITNVRLDGLRRIGIDYEKIHKRFPSLVYASISAWGNNGPDARLPGYDIGAFWSVTGMTASIHTPGAYQVFPVGFGDSSTGANLLSGIGMALAHRIRTGEGLLVDTALLRVGYWCMSPTLLAEEALTTDFSTAPDYEQKTPAEPTWTSYRTRDNEHIMILHQEGSEQALRQLVTALALPADVCQSPQLLPLIRAAFQKTDYKDIAKRLELNSVCHTKMKFVLDAVQNTDDPLFHQNSRCFVSIPESSDVKNWPRMPFDASCSKEHFPRGRAPLLGEHTAAFLARGFSPVLPEADLKQTSNKQPNLTKGKGLLAGLTVIELADCGACAPAVGAQLCDYGASVIQIEPPSGHYLERKHPRFYNHLNRNKKSVQLDVETEDGKNQFHALLEGASIFVTSQPASLLRKIGADYESLRMKHPRLIYAIVTPWGLTGPDNNRGDLGAYWGVSGLSSLIAGEPPAPPPPLPYQMGELVSSIFLMAAIGVAVFHLQRTGEGQLVDVSLLRAGSWGVSQLGVIGQKDPSKLKVLQVPVEHVRDQWPVPTANCYRTKDGFWFQLLGVELPRHLHNTFRAFGISWRAYPRLILSLLTQVLPERRKTILLRLVPLFVVMNNEITRAVSKLTWAECQKLFQEKNVWYCPILVPAEAVRFRQALATGIFADTPNGRVITSPLYCGSEQALGPSLSI